MSSRPSTTTFKETANEYAVASGEELSDMPGEEVEALEMSEDGLDQEPEPEPEGMTFYHMDLYETKDRLEIFPEDQFIKMERDGDGAEVSESDTAGDNWASKAEQEEYELQKEVDELARQYGIGDGMAREEDLLEICAPIMVSVPSKQPVEQIKDLETEEAADPRKVHEKVESEFYKPNHQEANEETHNKEPSSRQSHFKKQCNENPLWKEPDDEEPGRKDPFSEEIQSEGNQNAKLDNKELHREENKNAKPGNKELQKEENQKAKLTNEEIQREENQNAKLAKEELQCEEPYNGEPQIKEPPNEEPQSKETSKGQPQREEEPCNEERQTENAHKGETQSRTPHNEEDQSEEPNMEEPRSEELCTGELHKEPDSEQSHIKEPPTKELPTEEPCTEESHTEEKHSQEPCMEELVNIDVNKADAVNETVHDESLSYAPEQKGNLRSGVSQTLEHGELQPREVDEPKTPDEETPDIFCITCKTPIRAFEKLFGTHKDHEVTKVPSAVQDIKDEIHKNMCRLEEQIAQMEIFASHLEEIFITVEENFGRQEQNFDMHFTEIMQTLTQRYDEKTQALEEEKKQKLETLYGQLVDCGRSLDTSKDLMETIQELFKSKDKVAFVKTAVDTVDRLEEFLKAEVDNKVLTYPDYENKTIDFSEVQQLLDSINTLPAPSAPVINPQTPNSATGTSVKVCWSLFSEDTVESYHLYYKPVSDGAPNEERAEFVVHVKETYCTVENLVPNTQYEFWVTALNTTGTGPASERAVYVTAPSPPVIKYKQCRNCENAALICWESGENLNPVDSYTVEICKMADEERGQCITESIVGIPSCQCLVPLMPGETYNIYVRAVNVGGPSEKSAPVTVLTEGTVFHLDDSTAHPLLSILDKGLTIFCEQEESLGDLPYHYNSFTRCIAVMGNLIPVKGKHYWEVDVEELTEYRIGVAFEDTNRNGYFGANNTSWCMRHAITPSRHKYEFLHCGATPDVRTTIPPQIIGILLDYDNCKLSFFNMEPFQHLHTFSCQFQHLVHPCFALEKPGILRIRNGISIPQHVRSY